MRIALAAGDGIGSEIMDATLSIMRAAGVTDHLEFVPVEMGKSVFESGNSRGITDAAVRTVEECGVLFKGPMETPKGGGGKSINVTARKMWSAYANYRHFRSLPGVKTPFSHLNLDFAIVRENIEDTYGGIEHRVSDDMMVCKRIITAPGCDQVLAFTFDTARRMGVTKVHCGHKANIMKMTDGLFLERFKAIAAGYPGIETGDVIIDALCMNLVMKPQQYQMVVLPNLQGDIVSDLAAGLVGGLGFAPSANIGRNISIFEAVHGTAPDIAGRNLANPTALILSGLMMLRHVGLMRHAAVIENALLSALEAGAHTGDFGDPSSPTLGTAEFGAAIVKRLGSEPRTIRPAAVPSSGGDAVTFRAPPRPAAPIMMRTFSGLEKAVAGVDLYIDGGLSAAELASSLQRMCEGTPFELTLISCRGTQVWPRGSVFTECVDYWRARLEVRAGSKATQDDAVRMLASAAREHTVSEYALLRTFAGTRGFSLAQGQ